MLDCCGEKRVRCENPTTHRNMYQRISPRIQKPNIALSGKQSHRTTQHRNKCTSTRMRRRECAAGSSGDVNQTHVSQQLAPFRYLFFANQSQSEKIVGILAEASLLSLTNPITPRHSHLGFSLQPRKGYQLAICSRSDGPHVH